MFSPEFDLILMSAVIFLPALFALLLLFIPRGKEEGMRWVTLFGTALTFVASTWLLIDYLKVVDFYINRPELGTLEARAFEDAKAHEGDPSVRPVHGDQVARYPWIKQFSIEYFL